MPINQRHPYRFGQWGLSCLLWVANMQPMQALGLATAQSQIPNLPPTQDVLPPSAPSNPIPTSPAPTVPPANLLETPTLPSNSIPVPETPLLQVTEFQFEGNTAFSDATLSRLPPVQQALQQALKEKRSLAELLQVVVAVVQFYQEEGYATTSAELVIPEETRQRLAGPITIQVREGEVEDIRVTGTQRLYSSYIRDRLALAAGNPLNTQRLQDALVVLQQSPVIEQIAAQLSQGTNPNASILDVQVKEAQTFNLWLNADNGRSPSVGSLRRQIQLQEANLTGAADSLDLSYANTDGSDSIDLSYTIPFNRRNGTLSFNYGASWSQVIEPPFNTLDILSNSRYYELSLRQPVIQSPAQEFVLGLALSHRETETSLLGIPFPLSPGADEKGKLRISALRFNQQWIARSDRQVIALRSQFNLGLGILNATLNRSGPDSHFFSWQGQSQWVRLLAPDTLFLLRTNLQISDRPLVGLEQFGVGGLGSVRGYRQDTLLTDNGLFATAELQFPILRIPKSRTLVKLIPFADYGLGWNWGDREDPSPSALSAVGLGLQWQQSNWLTARLDWGIPFVSVNSRARTWQENGLTFSVQLKLF